MQQMMRAESLTKSFGGKSFQLGPVDLQLEAGDCFALFGQNGAGKSTLFQILSGNTDATTGTVLFTDKKLTPEKFELRRRIGYLPQNSDLPRWVTGSEVLSYAAKLHELSDAKEAVAAALAYWDCSGFAHKPLAALSHGMQKRIALALAHLHQPDLLILDEPFTGLDIVHVHALEEMLRQRHRDGKVTILSTHELLFAAKLCNRAGLMAKGKLEPLPTWDSKPLLQRIEMVEHLFFREQSPS